MASRTLFYFGLLKLINTQDIDKSVCKTATCSNLEPPTNLHISCNSPLCELQCNATDACNNILYTCGNVDSVCTIKCLSDHSCSNLTVVSHSAETYINCLTPNSCIDSSFVCNPYSTNMDTQCNLDCTSQSCQNINYFCTGYIQQCTASCTETQSCHALDMICDQHISANDMNVNMNMTCDLVCNSYSSNGCGELSQFRCTQQSNAQCQCTGQCSTVDRYRVETINIPITATQGSHTFNVIDVEIYAVFSILWLLLFIFSMFVCWRLHVTLEFFRNIRTVVLLVVIFVFEVFYYCIFCLILWANSVAYSIESSIHFYVWSCYMPVMLHISLLFSLCAYYNKHFHRDGFLRIFFCYGSKKRIPKILKQFNFTLLLFFLVPMIGVIAAHTNESLIGIIIFLTIFALFGLLMSIAQLITSLLDMKSIHMYEQPVEKALIVFVSVCSLLFAVIFVVNLVIGLSYNAEESTQNIEGIRLTQLIFELLMLVAMIAMIFYIYYDFIMGIDEEEDEDATESERTHTITHTEGSVNEEETVPVSTQMQQIDTHSFENSTIQQRPRNASTNIFNDPSDDEKETVTPPRITRRSTTNKKNKNIKNQMGLSINAKAANSEYVSGDSETRQSVDIVRHKYKNTPPPSIDVALAKHGKIKKQKSRKLPELPLFGAPLLKQKLISSQSEDYEQIPYALVVLKKYLFQFNAHTYVGIFANGSIENIRKSPRFMNGIASKVDINGVRKLIETNKISKHKFEINKKGEERHYAMVFSELIKLWLELLPQPLLQDLQVTFFNNMCAKSLQRKSSQIKEPNWSTLRFIWDICVEISKFSAINKMTVRKLSQVIAPYLYKHENKQIKSKSSVVTFCEIGIKWRKQSYQT